MRVELRGRWGLVWSGGVDAWETSLRWGMVSILRVGKAGLRRAVWKQTFERRPYCAQCLSTGETFDRGSGWSYIGGLEHDPSKTLCRKRGSVYDYGYVKEGQSHGHCPDYPRSVRGSCLGKQRLQSRYSESRNFLSCFSHTSHPITVRTAPTLIRLCSRHVLDQIDFGKPIRVCSNNCDCIWWDVLLLSRGVLLDVK